MDQEPKRIGRPPKNPELVKKGTRSWTPSNLGDVLNKEPGYRYRWARKDQDNVAKKQEEQWETVSSLNDSASYGFPSSRPDEGRGLSGVVERRDSILMRMPEETAKQRDEYINSKTERTTRALSSQTRKDLGKNVPMHGAITHDQRGVKTVIE